MMLTQRRIAEVAYTTPQTIRENIRLLLETLIGDSHFTYEVARYKEGKLVFSYAMRNVPLSQLIGFMERWNEVFKLGYIEEEKDDS